jgi:hypothetical protein
MCPIDVSIMSTFKYFSMPGFIVFPIDSDVSIMSVGHLDYSKFRWQHLSDSCIWMTEACLKLNNYENSGPCDHWRQIQIANTETHRNTAWVLHLWYLLNFGGEGLLWGR